MIRDRIQVDTGLRARLRQHQIHILENSLCTFGDATLAEPPFAPMMGVSLAEPASFGAFSYSYSPLVGVCELGRYCSIADHVSFAATEHPTDRVSTSSFSYDPGYIWRTFAQSRNSSFAPTPVPAALRPGGIRIGHDVWIGTRAYVRAGISIGTGAIIGAHAVVTRDVPPFAVVVGNPGRVVRYRFERDVSDALLASKWWRYAYTDFGGLNLEDPLDFAASLQALEEQGSIEPYSPDPLELATLLRQCASPAAALSSGES